MHHKREVQAIVFYVKKDELDRINVDQYATPGFANNFLMTIDPESNQNTLDILKATFAQGYRGMYDCCIIDFVTFKYT